MSRTPGELVKASPVPPLAEGYLKKKGDKGIAKLWRTRWFCLIGNLLHYAESPTSPVVGTIQLDVDTVIATTPLHASSSSSSASDPNTGSTSPSLSDPSSLTDSSSTSSSISPNFQIRHPIKTRIYHLQAATGEEAASWCRALQSVVEQSTSLSTGNALIEQASSGERVCSGLLYMYGTQPAGADISQGNSSSASGSAASLSSSTSTASPSSSSSSSSSSFSSSSSSSSSSKRHLRWCVLNQNVLAYYQDEREEKLLGVLTLEDCKVVVMQPPHIRKERSHPSTSRRVISPRVSSAESVKSDTRASAVSAEAKRHIEMQYPVTGNASPEMAPEPAPGTPRLRLHATREARVYNSLGVQGSISPRVETEGISTAQTCWFQVVNPYSHNIFMDDFENTLSPVVWFQALTPTECQSWAKNIRVAVGSYSERFVDQLEEYALFDDDDDDEMPDERESTTTTTASTPRTRRRADTQLLSGQTAQSGFQSLIQSDDCESAEWVNCFLNVFIAQLRAERALFLAGIQAEMSKSPLPSFIRSLTLETLDFDDASPRICGVTARQDEKGSHILAAFDFDGCATVAVRLVLVPVKVLKKKITVEAKIVITRIQGVLKLAFARQPGAPWVLCFLHPPFLDMTVNIFLGKGRSLDIALVPKLRSFLSIAVRSLFNRFLVPPSTMQISIPVPLSKQEPEWKFVRQQKKGEVVLLESPVRIKIAKLRLAQRFFAEILNVLPFDVDRLQSLASSILASHLFLRGFSSESLPSVVGLKRTLAVLADWKSSLKLDARLELVMEDVGVGKRKVFIDWGLAMQRQRSAASAQMDPRLLALLESTEKRDIASRGTMILSLNKHMLISGIVLFPLPDDALESLPSAASSASGALSPRERERAELKGAVFGEHLSALLPGKHLDSNGVPLVLVQCVDYLEEYLDTCGLFRIAGDHVKLRSMCQKVNEGEDAQIGTIKNPHLVAALFKRFLGDLPEPLCTTALFSEFIAVAPADASFEDPKQVKSIAKKIHILIKRLPPRNRQVLSFVVQFLYRVQQNKENKMSAQNLSLVFGPLLLTSSEPPSLETLKETGLANAVIHF
eukprot:CAMPEP_0174238074 /NCGR_PEP_ID=MMETSP0417-20130205/10183_1 /TAXON_ID=242541 /ORGANISM="Mayorella sp, Strain BSH-02190019" /LENGTH=1076 /DNA_ID=CAMNT_0015316879 /DNA_START=44 /DNA_END=3271 /DNA_ORIENTATION=+